MKITVTNEKEPFGLTVEAGTYSPSYETLSGSIVTFSDAWVGSKIYPNASIVPVQSGSGNPSPDNIRPITGFSSVDVSRCGKNLLVNTMVNGTNRGITASVNDDGSVSLSGSNDGTQYSSFNISTTFKTKSGVSYTISGGISSDIFIRDVTAGVADTGDGVTFTGDGNIHTLHLRVAKDYVITGSVLVKPMIRVSGDDTFEPYNGITKTISLGSTYYGGTLNVDSGVLTVTHLMNTFTGASGENWTKSSSTAVDRYLCLTSDIFDNTNGTAISNIYPQTNYGGTSLNHFYFDNSNNTHRIAVNFAPAGTTSATDIKTFLSSNNLTVVGKLATPTTIQLTGEEITALLGENNVWASSGDVEVTYRKGGM